MTELMNMLTQFEDVMNVFTIQDVVITILLSFVLSLVIAWIYKITHRGASYTQSFVHTLVLVSMVVAIIMLIVGSNIARAFTLVGALSIIRFRNAVKETRDVGFIFFAMAIGMACGTRFYPLAIVATFLIGALVWVMERMDLFAKEVKEQLLRIRLPADIPYENLFDAIFSQYLARQSLIAVETVQAGTLTEVVYSVELKRNADVSHFLSDVRKLNQNNKVSLITGMQEVDL